MHRTILLLLSAALLAGLASQVRADGLIANWKLDEPAGSTSFADSSGNGNTGTLHGADSLTTIQGPYGPSGPTALDFNGVAGNLSNTATVGGSNTGAPVVNPNPTYIGVPYNPTLSGQEINGGSWLGLTGLTISAWIYLPTGWSNSSQGSEIMSYYPPGTEGSTPGQVYQLGDAYQAAARRMAFVTGSQGGSIIDEHYASPAPGHATPGVWQLITATYTSLENASSQPAMSLYYNGVLEVVAAGGGVLPQALTPAQSALYSTLYLGNGWSYGDGEWLGGLSDVGLWSVCLTGAPPGTDGMGTVGQSGGEVSAIYNAPTSGIAALQQYGVSAMDKLFTLYDTKLAAPTTVTTGNGTLTWKYVAGGLPGVSGGVGSITGGAAAYYMQLNSAGGGVETVLPGDANLDGQVDVNDLTIVLSHFAQTGMAWTQGEFTGDGTVDVNDLTIVLAHYGQSVGASAGSLAAVPEPGSAAPLAGIGLAMLFGWRRSRGRRLSNQ